METTEKNRYTSEEQNEEFRKYREQMHRNDAEEETRPIIPTVKNKIMQTVFACIMVIVYVGVGVLLLFNVFKWSESITVVRWIVGIVLIIYGIFRAYRYFKN